MPPLLATLLLTTRCIPAHAMANRMPKQILIPTCCPPTLQPYSLAKVRLFQIGGRDTTAESATASVSTHGLGRAHARKIGMLSVMPATICQMPSGLATNG